MSTITESNIVALEAHKWVEDVYGMSPRLQVHTMHPNYDRIKQNEISISIQEYECAALWGEKGAKEVSTSPAPWKTAAIKARLACFLITYMFS